MTEKQERSIRQRVGRAIAKFRRENSGHVAYHVYIDGKTARVSTRAAGGDNVSWAKVPMTFVWEALNPICKQVGRDSHCCGHVSSEFILR
ncbi:MAG: hypothetical protein GY841_18575 [FCB group bacterium]|nr:hypothetical protein [FCB group bacterium]